MATVPRYDQRRVQTAPIPGARATVAPVNPEAPLPDLSGAANAWGDLIQRERQKADQIAVLDARNKLTAAKTALLLDPKTGALNRKGKDAFSTPETVHEEWKKRTSEIEAGLTSDPQRQAFREQATEIGLSMHDTLQRHVAAEGEVYDKEQTLTALAQTQEEILLAVSPGERKRLIEVRASVVADHATRQGVAPEVRDFRVATVRSDSHAAVAIQMSDAGQDLAADGYFAANKDSMLAGDREKVQKALEVGSVLGESQRQSLAIVKSSETREEALAKVDEIEDARVQERTRAMVNERYREMKDMKRENDEERFQRGAAFAEQGRRPPPSIWGELSLQERSAIDSRIRELRSGVGARVDHLLWHDLRLQVASEDPTERAKFKNTRLDILYASGKLTEEQFTQLTNAKANMKAGKPNPALDSYRTEGAFVQGAIDGLKLDKKKHPREVQMIHNLATAAVLEWKRVNKMETIDDKSMKGIMDQIVMQRVEAKPLATDGSTRLYETLLKLNPDKITSIDQVPAADQLRIKREIAGTGLRPTDEGVRKEYVEWLRSLQAGLER